MEKKETQDDNSSNSRFILALLVSVIILLPFIVLFSEWQSTRYHEAGHLEACVTVGISCELEEKGFVEYSAFVISNIAKGIFVFPEMEVKPDVSEFCNLSHQEQQLIRIGGFHNNSKIMMLLSFIVFAELMILLGVVAIMKIRSCFSLKIILILLIITFITSVILFVNAIQLGIYLSKNVGDLFYFPC